MSFNRSIPEIYLRINFICEPLFGLASLFFFHWIFGSFPTHSMLMIYLHTVLPSTGIGALSAREAEGRANVSAGEKV